MREAEVEERFPCGKVTESFANYRLVRVLGRMFYLAMGIGVLWHSRITPIFTLQLLDYILVIFCLWYINRQDDALVFITEKGLVLRRRAEDFSEWVSLQWEPDEYYLYVPYSRILGFTMNWEEMHMSTDDGGILLVRIDWQFMSYKDKLHILSIVEDKYHMEEEYDN